MNKIPILIAFEVLVGTAIVAGIAHHWDNKPQINVAVECFHTNNKQLNCVIVDETR
jgi:hypothetical protein